MSHARIRPLLLGMAVVSASQLAALTAHADGTDIAAAQALFDAGKTAMQKKEYDVGCPKLGESFRLDPAGGTAFALALCNEAWGKTATAWGDYNQALAIARRDRRSDREAAAVQRIAALEKRLVRIHLVVTEDVPSLQVHRDGAMVGRAQWGLTLPVDPGKHTFDASAEHRRPWQKEVDATAEGTTVEVTVPALEQEPLPPPTAAPAATVPPAASSPPVVSAAPPKEPANSAPPRSDGSSQRLLSYIVGGVGIAGLGTGAVLGLMAQSKWSEAEKACPQHSCTNTTDQQRGKDAGTFADVSSVGFAVGGVGVVAAVVLYLTAPSAVDSKAGAVRVAPDVRPGVVGMTVGGTL